MSNEIISMAVPFLIGGVVGIAIGAIVAFLFAGGKKEAPEEPAPREVERLPEGITRKQHAELARLWRERAGSALQVEVDGKIIPAAEQLTPETRRALENAIREWALWLGLGKAAKPEVLAPVTVAQPTPQPAPVTAPVAPVLPASARIPSTPLPVNTASAGGSAKGMVEQIDEIVQDMLPGSALEGHTLKVRSDFKEGVVVFLDDQRFLGIGEVTDPQAKVLLQAAVAEWERRMARERGWN